MKNNKSSPKMHSQETKDNKENWLSLYNTEMEMYPVYSFNPRLHEARPWIPHGALNTEVPSLHYTACQL